MRLQRLSVPRLAWVAWLAAGVVPLLVYLPTLGYGFVYDDVLLIVDNAAIHDLTHVGAYFTQDVDSIARGADGAAGNYYRPFALIVMALVWHAVGAHPGAWHAAVVVLHGCVAVLAMAVLRMHGMTVAVALAGALLFALHPIHVNSVAWISGIQDVLLGITALSAYLLFLMWSTRRTPLWLALGLVAFGLALLCKESAVGFVILIAGQWVWGGHPPVDRDRRSLGLAVLSCVLLVLGYLALRWSVFGGLIPPAARRTPLLLSLASVPMVICEYVRLLVWPLDLSFFSPTRPVTSIMSPPALFGFVGLVVIATLAVVWTRRRPEAFLMFLWFGAWLLPYLNLWALNPEWIVMDRYLYLPALACAWVLSAAQPGRGVPQWSWSIVLLVIIAFAGLTRSQMRVFRDPQTFWSHAVRGDPNSSVAWMEWGRLLTEQEDFPEAHLALQRAVALDPTSLDAWQRLGNLAFREGNADEAVRNFQHVLERNPGDLPSWKNLPAALVAAGRPAEALSAARTAAQRFPRDAEVASNLAVLLREAGQKDEALVAIQRARALAPGNARFAFAEAMLLNELGRIDDARRATADAMALTGDPNARKPLDAPE